MKCPYCKGVGTLDSRRLADRMKAYRAEHLLDIRAAARLAEVSSSMWHLVETGQRHFGPQNLERIRNLITA